MSVVAQEAGRRLDLTLWIDLIEAETLFSLSHVRMSCIILSRAVPTSVCQGVLPQPLTMPSGILTDSGGIVKSSKAFNCTTTLAAPHVDDIVLLQFTLIDFDLDDGLLIEETSDFIGLPSRVILSLGSNARLVNRTLSVSSVGPAVRLVFSSAGYRESNHTRFRLTWSFHRVPKLGLCGGQWANGNVGTVHDGSIYRQSADNSMGCTRQISLDTDVYHERAMNLRVLYFNVSSQATFLAFDKHGHLIASIAHHTWIPGAILQVPGPSVTLTWTASGVGSPYHGWRLSWESGKRLRGEAGYRP